jgi:nucleoside-triphosphatase THEP1
MYKHLFLEADSGAGKSTLIRKIIAPYINETGGFTSQRLQDQHDETIAFRIVPAQDLRLAVPYEDTTESIFRIITEDVKGLNKPEIFESEGLKYLTDNDGKKLILLDEIGGIELRNDAFRNKLHEVLAGDIPCIGVIKQNQKAARMSCQDGKTPVTVQYNMELREKMLNEYGCKILQFERNNPAVEHEVHNFIKNIFR